MTYPANTDRYRDFDEGAPDLDAVDGPVFVLGGEEFHCLPAAPGGAMLRLVNAIGKDARGRTVYNLPDIDAFIREVLIEDRLVPAKLPPAAEGEEGEPSGTQVDSGVMVTEPADDVERWEKLMNDKKRPLHIQQLGDLLLWLQGEYTSRPTKQSGR